MRVRACCRSTRLSRICVAQRGDVKKKDAFNVFKKHVGRGILGDALKTLAVQQEQQAAVEPNDRRPPRTGTVSFEQLIEGLRERERRGELNMTRRGFAELREIAGKWEVRARRACACARVAVAWH